jgi:hypothetical protein
LRSGWSSDTLSTQHGVHNIRTVGLDRVFTGNMTGDVAVPGLALAGGDDLPIAGPALALAGFTGGVNR